MSNQLLHICDYAEIGTWYYAYGVLLEFWFLYVLCEKHRSINVRRPEDGFKTPFLCVPATKFARPYRHKAVKIRFSQMLAFRYAISNLIQNIFISYVDVK